MMSCSVIQNQETALHLAASGGHTDVVAQLVAKGANVNMKNWVS